MPFFSSFVLFGILYMIDCRFLFTLGFNDVSLYSCICRIKSIRCKKSLYMFEFILPLLGLEITIIIVDKRNKNLLIYCYMNILTINCLIVFWFQENIQQLWWWFGCYPLKSWSSINAMVATFIHPSTKFFNISQLIKVLKILKLQSKCLSALDT